MSLAWLSRRMGAFIGGAVSTCIFRWPQLNKEGIKILGEGGLQGIIFTIVSLQSGFATSQYVKEQNKAYALFGTYVLCGAAVGVVAKTLTQRLGTPTEVLTNFVVSNMFDYLGYRIVKKLQL